MNIFSGPSLIHSIAPYTHLTTPQTTSAPAVCRDTISPQRNGAAGHYFYRPKHSGGRATSAPRGCGDNSDYGIYDAAETTAKTVCISDEMDSAAVGRQTTSG